MALPDKIELGELLARHFAASNLLGRLHAAKVGLVKTKRPVRLATSSRLRTFSDDQAQGDTLHVGFSFELPPTGAVDYLSNLTPVTKALFDGLTSQYRRDAFTVAGVTDQRIIAKIRDTLGETLAKGGTNADFHKAVDAMTSEAGIEDLAAFDLDTVFQTNAGKAYGAGRLEQMREPGMMDALPYWQYWTAGDFRVRPAHAALDGFCARAIDPVWLKIYAPWDFNCRCSVIPVLPEDAPEGSNEGGWERLPLLTRIQLADPKFNFRSVAEA